MQKIITLDVKIRTIVFSNEENFHILNVEMLNNNGNDTNLDKFFMVKGVISNVLLNQSYKITGIEVNDSKYGLQFNLHSSEIYVEKKEQSIVDYLSSDLFPKIGSVTAQRIVDVLGIDTIEILENKPEVIEKELTFLTPSQKQILGECILQNVYIEKIHSFFENFITIELATKIYVNEGIDALEKYSKNPYLLFFTYKNINFLNIDRFAVSKEIVDFNSQIRIEAIIFKIMKELQGHTYINEKDIKMQLRRFSVTDFTFLENAIVSLKSQSIVEIIDENIMYKVNYDFEKNIARKINSLTNQNSYEENIGFELSKIQSNLNIEYSEKQLLAISSVFNNNINIITGGPGTGKTTIINAITKIYSEKYPKNSIALIAPTGKAATRMSEVTKMKAQTIHSLIGINVNDDKTKFNAFNKLEEKLIILDEASMVDIETFSKLLDAIKLDTKFVIVGDANQLSSVGPGQVLNDLIISKKIPIIKLDVIQRQSENSHIIKLANDVLDGKLDKEMFKTKFDDFEYYQISDLQSFSALDALLKKELVKYNRDDIQIITPRRSISNGLINSTVNNINKHVQPIFNDCKTFLFSNGFHKFYLRDRIINNENIHDKLVANGDQGTLELPIFKKRKLDKIGIDFYGNMVEFEGDELKKIDLAYATTVHKSQGSEYKLVILFILPEHGQMIAKRLIYTAITRAKEKLIICGNFDYISNAILNEEFERRNTNLVRLIEGE